MFAFQRWIGISWLIFACYHLLFGRFNSSVIEDSIVVIEDDNIVSYQTHWKPLEEGKNVINVHLIPHTHLDAGWQVSAEEYQFSTVDVILDNVLLQLEENPNRKFTLAEVSFLASWFSRQSRHVRSRMRRLIQAGRIEIVNGGWVQHDEACPLYGDMIDQTTRGHEWLRRHVSDRHPRVAWQLDPFGHSATQAWLLSKHAGMNALFFSRSDYRELATRYGNGSLEYIWEPSQSFPEDRIFVSQTYGQGKYGGYYSFFPFEDTSARDRNYVQDDKEALGYNVPEWIERIAFEAKKQAQSTKTSHQMWMLGNDFTFQSSASRWFSNYDKLIHYVNHANLGIRLFYSTPSDYVRAKRNIGKGWEVRRDKGDLMPLRDGPHEVWSGYFTSRPSLKLQFRMAASFLHFSRQVETLSVLSNFETDIKLSRHVKPTVSVGKGWTDDLEGALAVVSHHDGITGTARQAVSNDYAHKLAMGSLFAERHVLQVLQKVAEIPVGGMAGFCNCNTGGPLDCLNISTCSLTSSRTAFTLLAWNPLGVVTHNVLIDIPVRRVDQTNFVIRARNGHVLSHHLVPIDSLTKSLPALYGGNQTVDNPATHRLLFQTSLPAMGYSTFRITQVQPLPFPSMPSRTLETRHLVENDFFRLDFNAHNTLVGIFNKVLGKHFPFEIEWGYYHSSTEDLQRSGAYLFRPNASTLAWNSSVPLSSVVSDFKFGVDVLQVFSSFVSHTIRLYRDEISVTYTVGPIPIEDGMGKEVVVRYRVNNLDSKRMFFTDSNGRETIQRMRNERPISVCNPAQECNLEAESVASNYYPVSSFIGVSDQVYEMDVLVQAAQGGTSLSSGQVELMVHRRILYDDNRGVEEPLNETMCGCGNPLARPGEMNGGCDCVGLVIRGRHHIVLHKVKEARKIRRLMGNALQHPVQMAFFDHEPNDKGRLDERSSELLKMALPPQVHLLTFSSNYHSNGTLVRFSHLFQIGEHAILSQPVWLDLAAWFKMPIRRISSLSLTGYPQNDEGADMWLHAMEVKTFVIHFQRA